MGDSEFARFKSMVRQAASTISEQAKSLAFDRLDPACQKLAEQLRERCPDALATAAGKPLAPGATAPPVHLTPQQSAAMFTTSFVATAGGPAPATATAPAPAVVWRDGEHELLVYPAKARLLLQDGLALAGIPVYTEQTGEVEIAVPFAVGRPSAPTGLMIATEPVPRGPALVIERWGDQLIAAAWHALLNLAAGVAAAAGTDSAGAPLIPVSLTADPGGFTVLPQATPLATIPEPGKPVDTSGSDEPPPPAPPGAAPSAPAAPGAPA